MSEEFKKDPFLEDLQRQCLVDSKDHLDEFLVALAYFQQDSMKSLSVIANRVHTLKGNCQAAGFLHFAGLLHDFETVISSLETNIHKGNWKLSSEELSLVEFFLSDIQFNFVDYVNELLKDLNDTPEKALRRKSIVQNLGTWSPGGGAQVSFEQESPAQMVPEKDIPQVEPVESKLELVKAPLNTRPESQMYFLCGNRGQKFAVPIQYVVEILQKQPMTGLPAGRKDIVGLVNLRGAAVPVLNLEFLIGERASARYIVICSIEGRRFAFEVEEAEQVMYLSEDNFQQISQSTKNEIDGWDKVLTHLTIVESKTIFVLNLNQLVAAA